MAKTRSRKHSVRYQVRKGKNGTSSTPSPLQSHKDALIVKIDCGGKWILTVEITGGGQIHIEDAQGRRYLSALEFAKKNKNIKWHQN